MKNIKLFCIPYAGGSGRVYLKWKPYLSKNIQLYPIELAGRGSRFCDDLYENHSEAVQDICNEIFDKIDDSDYVIFGHSMGCSLVLEVVHTIEKMNLKRPKCLIVSGDIPPHIEGEYIHQLPLYKFMERIYALGGLPDEIMGNEKLYNIFSSIIYSDIKMSEINKIEKISEKIVPISMPLFVLRGEKETDTTMDRMLEWKKYTMDEFEIFSFEGNHFFIFDNIIEVCTKIEECCRS